MLHNYARPFSIRVEAEVLKLSDEGVLVAAEHIYEPPALPIVNEGVAHPVGGIYKGYLVWTLPLVPHSHAILLDYAIVAERQKEKEFIGQLGLGL